MRQSEPEVDSFTKRLLADFMALKEGLVPPAEGERGGDERGPDVEEFARRAPSPDLFRELVREAAELDDLLPQPRPAPQGIGAYRIEREIGTGGMGVVYAARAPDGREVAIKVLPDDRGLDPESVARFRRELDALARVEHPHIARSCELERDGERQYLVMDLLAGGSLAGWIEQRRRAGAATGTAEIRFACGVVAKMARAAAAAHQNGVIHRDIKPANILFDRSGEPFLADFGLACLTEESALTTADRILGTPSYMAPERVLEPDSRRDPRIDVFSLGVTLFEAIALARPFPGALPDVLAGAAQGAPRLGLFVAAANGRALQALLDRCLDARPSGRYRSAGELADDLERWLAGQPVLALRGARRRRILLQLRRHKLAAAAAALLLAALGVTFTRELFDAAARRRQVEVLLAQAEPALAAFRAGVDRIIGRIENAEAPADNDWRHLGERNRRLTRPQEAVLPLAALRRSAEQNKVLAELPLMDAMVLGSDRARLLQSEIERSEAVWMEHEGRFEEAEWLWSIVAKKGIEPPSCAIELGPPPVPAKLCIVRYRMEETRLGAWPEEPIVAPRPWTAAVRFDGLAPGSYRIDLTRLDGTRTVRHPLLLHRGDTHRLLDPVLPTDAEIGAGWEYIPAGVSLVGGDPRAESSEARQERHVAGFFMKSHEETLAEYLLFLEDLAGRGVICADAEHARYMTQRGWTSDVPAHIPRDDRDTPPKYRLEDFRGGKVPYLGVGVGMALHRISPRDALHYVDWLNARATERGEPWVYSLPTGDQWERAARGADGRAFPWGSTFSWSFTSGGFTRYHVPHDEATHMMPGRFVPDRSPFGLFDMAGNVREICADFDPVSRRYLIRGGEESFFEPDQFRLAARRGGVLDEFNWDFGIRLVRVGR